MNKPVTIIFYSETHPLIPGRNKSIPLGEASFHVDDHLGKFLAALSDNGFPASGPHDLDADETTYDCIVPLKCINILWLLLKEGNGRNFEYGSLNDM